MQGGSGASCCRPVFKITAVHGCVKAGGTPPFHLVPCYVYVPSVNPAYGRQRTQPTVRGSCSNPATGPFLCNIHHGQMQHFQQAAIRREDRLCLGRFPQLSVKSFDCVGRIDQTAHLLRVLEIGAQVGSILPPGPSDLGVFSVPAFRKSVQCSNLIDSGVGCLQVCHERLYVLVGHIGYTFPLMRFMVIQVSQP